MIAQEFMELLVCPAAHCRGGLDERAGELVCGRCRRRFAIRDGVPHLVPDEGVADAATCTGARA